MQSGDDCPLSPNDSAGPSGVTCVADTLPSDSINAPLKETPIIEISDFSTVPLTPVNTPVVNKLQLCCVKSTTPKPRRGRPRKSTGPKSNNLPSSVKRKYLQTELSFGNVLFGAPSKKSIFIPRVLQPWLSAMNLSLTESSPMMVWEAVPLSTSHTVVICFVLPSQPCSKPWSVQLTLKMSLRLFRTCWLFLSK